MTQPVGESLKDLNACTNTNPQAASSTLQACIDTGNKERSAMVQWIKSACPSVSAFPGDTANSSYICKTNAPELNAKIKNTSNVKINVTEYTISFCPELAPTSPYRNLKGTASNP